MRGEEEESGLYNRVQVYAHLHVQLFYYLSMSLQGILYAFLNLLWKGVGRIQCSTKFRVKDTHSLTRDVYTLIILLLFTVCPFLLHSPFKHLHLHHGLSSVLIAIITDIVCVCTLFDWKKYFNRIKCVLQCFLTISLGERPATSDENFVCSWYCLLFAEDDFLSILVEKVQINELTFCMCVCYTIKCYIFWIFNMKNVNLCSWQKFMLVDFVTFYKFASKTKIHFQFLTFCVFMLFMPLNWWQ